MMNNILFVGLDYEFVKDVAYNCSIEIDRHFLDVADLIEYSLIDTQKLKLVCGVEYFEREQKKIIRSLNEYENIIISLPYSILLNDEYFDYLKNMQIVFLELDKQTLNKTNNTRPSENNLNIELLTYEELTKVLKKRANLTIKENNSKQCMLKIKQMIDDNKK